MDAGFSLLTAHDLLTKDVDELKALVAQRREAEAKRSRQGERQAAAGVKAEAHGAQAGEPMDEDEAPAAPGPAQRIPASDVVVLEGHSSEVFTCAWSTSNPLALASGSGDSTSRIWTLPAPGSGGAPVSMVLRHSAAEGDDGAGEATPGAGGDEGGDGKSKDVTTLDWSPDGSRLATGSYDGVARVWDTATGALVQTLVRHSGPIFSLRWSKSGAHLLSGSLDKSAVVWEGATGKVVQVFTCHSGPTMDVDWKDDAVFATCGSDCRIVVCRLGQEGAVRQIQGHSSEVNAVRWDPTGTRLASCSDDGTAKLWSVAGLEAPAPAGGAVQPTHVLRGHGKEIYTLKWSPTGPGSANPGAPLVLATASFDATVRLWDAATGACTCVLRAHKEPVYSVAFSPDGQHVASGSFDRWLHIWHATTGRLVRSYQGGGGIFEVCWSAQDPDAVAASFANNTVCVVRVGLLKQ